jgi:hypothetical protein
MMRYLNMTILFNLNFLDAHEMMSSIPLDILFF